MSTSDGSPPHLRPTIKQLDAPVHDFDEPEATRPEAAALDPDATGEDTEPPALHNEVEVAVIHERGGAQGRPTQWHAVEIWTGNRIYAIDGQMRCIAVIDRASGRPDDKHAFMGARLMGGEHKDGEGNMAFSHPLPTPTHEAVFQIASSTKGRYGHTSPVERVIVRIRVTHARTEDDRESDAVWEEITSTWRSFPV